MEQFAIVIEQSQGGVAASAQQPSYFVGRMTVVYDQWTGSLTNATQKLLLFAHIQVLCAIDTMVSLAVCAKLVPFHVGFSMVSIFCKPSITQGFHSFRMSVTPCLIVSSFLCGSLCHDAPFSNDAIVRSHVNTKRESQGEIPGRQTSNSRVIKATASWEQKFGKKPTDNIFLSNALFYFLGEDGFKEEADGGRLIEFGIEYAENSTFKSYGELETLDTTRITVFDAARFDWKINAGTVVYSELERLRAQAAAGKYDLIANKLENGKSSHISAMNRQMWSDGSGNGSQDIGGIQSIISATPTTGSVGQINRGTFSFWRNQQTSGAKTSTAYDNLRASMRSIYNLCSRGGVEETPMAWMTNRTIFEGYESILIANERIQRVDKTEGADAGIKNTLLFFKGAPGSYDEAAPDGNLYMFNNKALKLVYLAGGWMKMYPKVDPANQLANVHKVATFANMGTNNSRRLGVVTSIT